MSRYDCVIVVWWHDLQARARECHTRCRNALLQFVDLLHGVYWCMDQRSSIDSSICSISNKSTAGLQGGPDLYTSRLVDQKTSLDAESKSQSSESMSEMHSASLIPRLLHGWAFLPFPEEFIAQASSTFWLAKSPDESTNHHFQLCLVGVWVLTEISLQSSWKVFFVAIKTVQLELRNVL